jgi:hypothetical protein
MAIQNFIHVLRKIKKKKQTEEKIDWGIKAPLYRFFLASSPAENLQLVFPLSFSL